MLILFINKSDGLILEIWVLHDSSLQNRFFMVRSVSFYFLRKSYTYVVWFGFFWIHHSRPALLGLLLVYKSYILDGHEDFHGIKNWEYNLLELDSSL